MHTVEQWAEIRRLHKVEGLSQRAIAERLGLNRRTVVKALASPAPPRYQRASDGSILDPYPQRGPAGKPKIHALLAEDPKLRSVPHTCYRQAIEVRVDDQSVHIKLHGQEVAQHARCYGQHQTIIDREHQEAIRESRTMPRFTALKRDFLTAYGLVGHRFYEGLSRRTDLLTAALRQILELEQVYPHQDVLDALEAVMRQGSYDPAAVKYWLMFASQPVAAPPIPVPDTAHIPVEARDLRVYDGLMGGGR